MNRTALLLGLVAVGLGGWVVHLRQTVEDSRAEQAHLAAKLSELQELLQFSTARPTAPATPVSAPSSAPPTPSASPLPLAASVEPPHQPLGRQGMLAVLERQQALLKDPQYRAAMKTQHKMGMLQAYGDVGRALNLQPEETERLLDLLAEHQLQSQESGQSIRLATDRQDPDALVEWRQQMEQDQRRKEAEIAQLLGGAGLQAWKEYQESMGARSQVREFQSLLQMSATPLRGEQIEPLVSVILQEQRALQAEQQQAVEATRTAYSLGTSVDRMAMAEQNIERTARYNQRLQDAVAPYLSAEQHKRFAQLLDDRLTLARSSMQRIQAQGPFRPIQMIDMNAASAYGVIASEPAILATPP